MPRRPAIWGISVLALGGCAAPAQRTGGAEGVDPAFVADGRAPGTTLETPSFHAGARALGPRPEGVHWARATAGDPVSLTRLAEVEGALGLLPGIELGGEIGRVGLEALPFASDFELALGGVCQLATRVDEASKVPVLRAVLQSASTLVADGERLDPDGIHVCLRALDSLRRDQPAAVADLADAAFVAIRDRTGFSWPGAG